MRVMGVRLLNLRRFICLLGFIALAPMITLFAGVETSGGAYWIMAIGGNGRDYAPSFSTTDDGYIFVGMSSSYGLGTGTDPLNANHDFLVVKLDTNGDHLWSRTIGGADDERGSYSVRQTTDGGFLLTGSTKSFGAGATDLFIAKLDSNPRESRSSHIILRSTTFFLSAKSYI